MILSGIRWTQPSVAADRTLPGVSDPQRDSFMRTLTEKVGPDGPPRLEPPRFRTKSREFVGIYAGREPDPQQTTRHASVLASLKMLNDIMNDTGRAAMFLRGCSRPGQHMELPEIVERYARLRNAPGLPEGHSGDDMVLEQMREIMHAPTYGLQDLDMLQQCVDGLGHGWAGGICARQIQGCFSPGQRLKAVETVLSLDPGTEYGDVVSTVHTVSTADQLKRDTDDLQAFTHEMIRCRAEVDDLKLRRAAHYRKPEETLTQAVVQLKSFVKELSDRGLSDADAVAIYEGACLEARKPEPDVKGYVAERSYKLHPDYARNRARTREQLRAQGVKDYELDSVMREAEKTIDALPVERREPVWQALAEYRVPRDFLQKVPLFHQWTAADADFPARLRELRTIADETSHVGELLPLLVEHREGESFLTAYEGWKTFFGAFNLKSHREVFPNYRWAAQHFRAIEPQMSLTQFCSKLAKYPGALLEERRMQRVLAQDGPGEFYAGLESLYRMLVPMTGQQWFPDALHAFAHDHREALARSLPELDTHHARQEKLARLTVEHLAGVFEPHQVLETCLERKGSLDHELADYGAYYRTLERLGMKRERIHALAPKIEAEGVALAEVARLASEHFPAPAELIDARVVMLLERSQRLGLQPQAAAFGKLRSAMVKAKLSEADVHQVDTTLYRRYDKRYASICELVASAAEAWAARQLPPSGFDLYFERVLDRPDQIERLALRQWATGSVHVRPELKEFDIPDYEAVVDRMAERKQAGLSLERALAEERDVQLTGALYRGVTETSPTAVGEDARGVTMGGVRVRYRR